MNRCEVCGSPVEVVSSDEGTHHYRPAGQERIAALEAVIHDTLWMARRYASGRQTYAPSLVNQAIDTLAGMGITLRPDHTLVDDGGPSDTYAHDPVRERLEAENKRLREALKNAARTWRRPPRRCSTASGLTVQRRKHAPPSHTVSGERGREDDADARGNAQAGRTAPRTLPTPLGVGAAAR